MNCDSTVSVPCIGEWHLLVLMTLLNRQEAVNNSSKFNIRNAHENKNVKWSPCFAVRRYSIAPHCLIIFAKPLPASQWEILREMKECNVNPSPTDVSPNFFYWIMCPLDNVSPSNPSLTGEEADVMLGKVRFYLGKRGRRLGVLDAVHVSISMGCLSKQTQEPKFLRVASCDYPPPVCYSGTGHISQGHLLHRPKDAPIKETFRDTFFHKKIANCQGHIVMVSSCDGYASW